MGRPIARSLLIIMLTAIGFLLASLAYHVWIPNDHGPIIGDIIISALFKDSEPRWRTLVSFSLVFAIVTFFIAHGIGYLLTHLKTILRVAISSVIGATVSVFLLFIISSVVSFLDLASSLPQDRDIIKVSDSFATKKEKVRFLKQYWKTDLPILDAEYSIFDWTVLFGLNAGYDNRAVVKVYPEDVDRWLEVDWHPTTKQEAMQFDRSLARFGLMRKLSEQETQGKGFYKLPNLDQPIWQHTSQGDFYKSGRDAFMLIYRKEGIIIFTSRHTQQ